MMDGYWESGFASHVLSVQKFMPKARIFSANTLGKGARNAPVASPMGGGAARIYDPRRGGAAAVTGARKPPKSAAPWRGRPRAENPKSRRVEFRCTERDLSRYREAANRAGLSVADFLRAKALGKPNPRAVRIPPVEAREIARLYGEIGKIGSNVNQLAYRANAARALPHMAELQNLRSHLVAMHGALRRALGLDP